MHSKVYLAEKYNRHGKIPKRVELSRGKHTMPWKYFIYFTIYGNSDARISRSLVAENRRSRATRRSSIDIDQFTYSRDSAVQFKELQCIGVLYSIWNLLGVKMNLVFWKLNRSTSPSVDFFISVPNFLTIGFLRPFHNFKIIIYRNVKTLKKRLLPMAKYIIAMSLE